MLDKILAFMPFLAPIVSAVAAAFSRAPVPEPGDPDPFTVNAGDEEARREAAARAEAPTGAPHQ